MTTFEIRRQFLQFFEERDHRIVPSAPLVLPNDPTLLFTNAGMNPFKDVFTGRETRSYKRAVSSQRCLRVSGKHNDLEMVGQTPRHHTFFEMLGNFSFGDYFKEEAIRLAWNLITEVYQLPAERLWITVFGGEGDLEADEDSAGLWRELAGVPADRILALGAKDNFWRMGDTGPCGPCSEIHFDLGEDLTSVDGISNPETDDQRFLEIWNLVFMQFNQRSDGVREALPKPSIDTGMGLERISSVIQGKRSNYDTDLFVPILEATAKRAGVRYGADPETDFAMRVIADHSRAFCFLVADGVVPANDSRGYVLRRLLRRAIRYGRKLGLEEPFLHEVTPVVVETLSAVYPELSAAQAAVLDIGKREEQRFADTLGTGLVMLEEQLAELPQGDQPARLDGKSLFRLYDTFGFPIELARDIAGERGIELDEAGFEAEMARQRERAQASWKAAKQDHDDPMLQELAQRHSTDFEGYEKLRLDQVPLLALRHEGQLVDSLKAGQTGEALLETTPFYAEAGGQISDRGSLVGPQGRAIVEDVQRPLPGLALHRIRVEQGSLSVGQQLEASVDADMRQAVMRNHTATHLLHAALRDHVGTHVKQAGSLVASDRLRFDFSHFNRLNEPALEEIEDSIHNHVLADQPVETEMMDLDDALRSGAMALFGEKYGDNVRVVSIGDYSKELCGGTHCARTGEIGLVKLTQERGVASGTRRIEAVTGDEALRLFRVAQSVLRDLEEQFAVPREQLAGEISRRLDESRELQKEFEKKRRSSQWDQLASRSEQVEEVSGVKVLAERLEGVSPQDMRELADNLKQKLRSGVVVLGRAEGDKASLLVAVTDDWKGRLPAGDLVRELGRIIGGGGGGRPDMAEAGGKEPARLDEALRSAKALVAKRLEA